MGNSLTVKGIFNDVFAFLNGRKEFDLATLYDVYQDQSLFLALIGNLDEAAKIPFNDAMMECYDFYKRYRDRLLSDADWDAIVEDIKMITASWQGNRWCRSVLLSLLGVLETQDKEYRQSAGTSAGEDSSPNILNSIGEDSAGQQEQQAA